MLKDSFCPGFMFSGVAREGKKVIHIDDKPSFSNHILEGIRHESLESGRRVGHAKEYDSRFTESTISDEGGLALVSLSDVDIVISPLSIGLGKDLGIFKFVDEV